MAKLSETENERISGCNDMTNEMKRMKELVEQLNEARKLYYQKDTSIMSVFFYFTIPAAGLSILYRFRLDICRPRAYNNCRSQQNIRLRGAGRAG